MLYKPENILLFLDDYCVCMSLSNQTLGKVVYFTEAFCFGCYTAFEILKLALNRLRTKYNTRFTISRTKMGKIMKIQNENS